MVLASLVDPDQALFVEQSALALRGVLTVERLRSAWEALVAEHDILRTAFAWDLSDAPRQVVRSVVETTVTLLDDVDTRPARLPRLLPDLFEWQRRLPFDLTSAPLVRLAVVPADDRTILLWTHHHAILDGWSQMLLVGRLLRLCGPAPVPPVARAPAFADYEAWLHRRRPAPGPPSPARMQPTARLGGATARHGSRTRTLPVSPDADGASAATRLAAATALTLAQMLPGRQTTLGMTVAGRHEAFDGSLDVVGPCATTIAVQVCPSSVETFDELARRLENLAAASWLDHPPPVATPDVIVAWANYPPPRPVPADGALTYDGVLASDGGRTPTPITVVAMPSKDSIAVRVVNDRLLVSDDEADRFVDAVARTLTAADGGNAPVATADLVDRAVGALSPLRRSILEVPVVDPVEPPTGSTRRLAGCFAEALGRPVGGQDDFFALGGHSLAALHALELVRAATGTDATLRDLLETRTPARLERRLRHLRRFRAEPTLRPAEASPANRRDDEPPFELTEIQQAYWAGAQGFGSHGVPARTYGEVDVVDLDLPRLERCLNRLVARHPALRTVVTGDGHQRVLADVGNYRIEITEAHAEPSPGQVLRAVRERMLAAQHSPERWPLFCVQAARHGEGLTRLYLDFDLLIGDAASWDQLYRELSTLYYDEHTVLPAIARTPRDYIDARAADRDGARRRRAREYWRARLDSLPGPPELPTGKEPGREGTFSRRRIVLPAGESAALEAAAATAGTTFSGLLLGLFAEVLRHWARLPSFLVNVTSFDRTDARTFAGIVGDFTSLTLLEARQDGQTCVQRLGSLHARLWDDLDHRAYGGLDVLRDLARRDHNDGPRAPVVFTSTLDLPSATVDGPRIPFVYVHGLGRTPQVHLDYQVHRLDGQLVVNWDCLDGAIDADVLDAMFYQHAGLLRRVAATPNLLRETHVLEAASNALPTGELGRGTLLHGPLLDRASRDPHRPAVLADGRSVGFGELVDRARRIATLLRHRPDGPAAITTRRDAGQAAAVLAALLSGRPYLPIGEDWPAARVRAALQAAKATAVLTDDPARPGLPPETLIDVGVPLGDTDATHTHIEPRDLAYLICTSGSTGAPKVVAVEHRAARNTVLDINRRLQTTPDDRVLGVSSLAFDLSVFDLFGVLGAGGTLVLAGPTGPDPHDWHTAIRNHRVTIWNSVPLLLDLLLELPGDVSSLRACLLSGDWIALDLPARLRDRAGNCAVVALGGATEAAIWSLAYDVHHVAPSWTSIPYGRALSGQTVEILDADLRVRPRGVVGEICIGGVGLAREYFEDPVRTSEAFVRHPRTGRRLYKTGDWGRLSGDGTIELLGRFDDQVKIAGHRLEVPEVERALRDILGAGAAAVVATQDRFARRLVAFVTGDRSYRDLRAALAERLPSHAIPSEIRPIERLPLTSTGKLDRGTLRAWASELPARSTPDGPEPGRHELAPALLTRAHEMLGTAVGLDSDLLSEGATSIEVIRILAHHRALTGIALDVSDFYARPTLRTLLEAPRASNGQQQRGAARRVAPASASVDSIPVGPRLLGDVRPTDRGRRSPTAFSADIVPSAALASTLAALRPLDDTRPRRPHPSAGGRYAVQAVVHVRHGRVAAVPCGLYEYLPAVGDLRCRLAWLDLDESVHLGVRNDHLATQAAFTIFLVYEPQRLDERYGADAHDLALLEAGYVGQVLCEAAASAGLGLVPIHGVAVERLRWLLGPKRTLHTLLGGMPT